VGHVYIVEKHTESGPSPDIHRDEGEERGTGTPKPLEGEGVQPQGPEGSINHADIGLQHPGEESTDDGYGKNRRHIQEGTKKGSPRDFAIDNIRDNDAEEGLGKNGSKEKQCLITEYLKHDRVFEEESEVFKSGKEFISAHPVPFKETVIEIE
jgi:hypothetical protein